MSKFAWLFLSLTVTTGAMGLSANSSEGQYVALIATAVSASLLLVTLIVGRRIKFDPVLR